MANFWLQRKVYECSRCKQEFLHDRMYLHALFRCPKRVAHVRGVGGHPVPQTVPEAARDLLTPAQVPPNLLNGR
jgi:DNA-directed RNA polymerase subunit RPC12/RpoP